jgi:hypothetical protein
LQLAFSWRLGEETMKSVGQPAIIFDTGVG